MKFTSLSRIFRENITGSPSIHVASSEGVPGTDNYICDVQNCPNKRAFASGAEFRKHMDKHKRPHKCNYPNCITPSFGDKSGLLRHQREVHSSRKRGHDLRRYFCPELTCERHKRGFKRRWNLQEHQRRMHKEIREKATSLLSSPVSLGLADMSIPTTPNSVAETRNEDGGDEEGEYAGLQAKLRVMKAERARLDSDIRVLQKALDIVEASRV
ncbi:hypothetical protein GP486_000589 [Trichoglossum hirsutum]|uniref:C2H2-type domain-containing protein n=1 Tax=Trichoglossum hirsutum TaxID=265104 RepID=A0A9P8LIA2_9PEZI|nr:hypothetical protein GP486_000589 [Trichoglossum hirsutum]